MNVQSVNPKERLRQTAQQFADRVKGLLAVAQREVLETSLLATGIVAVFGYQKEVEETEVDPQDLAMQYLIYYDLALWKLVSDADQAAVSDTPFAVVGIGLLDPGGINRVEQLCEFAQQHLEPRQVIAWRNEWLPAETKPVSQIQ
ncbi:MAG: hypothetical protein WC508_04200 [Patescibacteria group bacterium]